MFKINWKIDFKIRFPGIQYSRKQFAFWRIAFGSYLVYYYLTLFPYRIELFSRSGLSLELADTQWTFYPDFFLQFDSIPAVSAMIILCVFFSFLIAIGFHRRIASFGLWLLVLWLYNRNQYTDSPEYTFMNWLIFANIFIPEGEGYSISKNSLKWKMPEAFYWGAWIILTCGYSYAGLSKLLNTDPVWMDGSAIYYILTSDHARFSWYGNFFKNLPIALFAPLTWGALLCQTCAPVLVYFRKTRLFWWIIATSVHVSLLFLVNLTQVTLGMLLVHLYIFDPQWISQLTRISFRRRTNS